MPEYGSINADRTEALLDFHDHEHEDVNHHAEQDGTLKAAVFGFSDGLCTNLNVVVGMYAALANGSGPLGDQIHTVILMTGLCGLFGGASSMAAGEWLSSRAEGEANKHELEKERWHHQTIPEHENADMCRMLQDSGLSDALAQQVANEVAAMPLDQRVAFHAKYELGIEEEDISAFAALIKAAYMWVAFAVGALIPILPWIIAPIHSVSADALFAWTIFVSMIAISLSSVAQVRSMYSGCARGLVYTTIRQLFVAAIAVGSSLLLNYFVTGQAGGEAV